MRLNASDMLKGISNLPSGPIHGRSQVFYVRDGWLSLPPAPQRTVQIKAVWFEQGWVINIPEEKQDVP